MDTSPGEGWSFWTWTIATKGTWDDPDFSDGMVVRARHGPWKAEGHLMGSEQDLKAAPMSIMMLMSIMPEGFWERDMPK